MRTDWEARCGGRELKAIAVLHDVPLYAVAAEVRINPGDLSRLLNERRELSAAQASMIGAAIKRLARAECDHASAR